jgi:RHS repeat-associated protein
VYFDNLTVNVTTGNIIEENHYYAYGLKIAAISSKKLGDGGEGNLANNYQYQGTFAETDADIGWQDFDLRQYDAQIARWEQQDPYEQYASPYLGMGADPINRIDPSGGFLVSFGTLGALTGSAWLDRLVVTAVGAGVGYAVDKFSGGNGWVGAGIGGAVAFGATFIPPFDINVLLGRFSLTVGSMVAQTAKAATDIEKIELSSEDIDRSIYASVDANQKTSSGPNVRLDNDSPNENDKDDGDQQVYSRIKYHYRYQVERDEDTREIDAVTVDPVTADPMIATYIDQYGRTVLRVLTIWEKQFNTYEILTPTTVVISWNATVTARYSYTDGTPSRTRTWYVSKTTVSNY